MDKEFNNVIDREDGIDLLSDNKRGKDFLEEDLSEHHKDLTLFGNGYDTSSEVSSELLDPVYSNKFKVYQISSKRLYGTKPDHLLRA